MRFTAKQANILVIGHACAAAFMLAQSVAMFVIAAVDGNQQIPVYSIHIHQWEELQTGSARAPTVSKVGTIYVEYLSAIFLALAGIDHCLVLAMWGCWYRKAAERGRAWLRWLEYFFSASVMKVNILILCDGSELQQIIAVFSLTATTMIFGAISDLSHNRFLEKLWAYAGCVPFVAAWEIIFYNFFASVGSNPNAYVVSIVVTLPILEMSFAVSKLVKSYSDRTPTVHFNYELSFIILSNTSKTLLAWLQFMGSRQIPKN